MVPAKFLLAGARELEPLRQGSLSYLCSVYSVLNGIQLALYPITLKRTDQQAIYLAGIAHLAKKRRLRQAMGQGMHDGAWQDLAAAMIETANERCRSSLKLQTSFHADHRRDVVLRRLRRILYDGSPVLLPIYGTYDHFTVVAGYTPQRLRLFDSAGMHWITIDRTTFAEEATTRHRTPISSICAILDDW